MVLMVQIDYIFISAKWKGVFCYFILKMFAKYDNGQYNVATNVIKCHKITFCSPLLRYGCHGYHHMT